MQHLVFLDKVNDMYDRHRVSKQTLAVASDWALGSMFTSIGVAADSIRDYTMEPMAPSLAQSVATHAPAYAEAHGTGTAPGDPIEAGS